MVSSLDTISMVIPESVNVTPQFYTIIHFLILQKWLKILYKTLFEQVPIYPEHGHCKYWFDNESQELLFNAYKVKTLYTKN